MSEGERPGLNPSGVNPFETMMMRVLDEHVELIGALTAQVERLTTIAEGLTRRLDALASNKPAGRPSTEPTGESVGRE